MVREVQPRDSRGYFMLPQAPGDAGYYVYGTPPGGVFQYAAPSMMTAILWLEREWQAIDSRKFGVGNISLADGKDSGEHATHKDGLTVDVRALRKDGLHLPVNWHQAEYDHDATARLIALLVSYPSVKKVLFNDLRIPGVRPWFHHDDHFHVEIKVGKK